MAIGHSIFDMPQLTTLMQKEQRNNNFEDCHHSHNLTRRRLKTWHVCGFYRVMLCISGTSHGPVSVRLSVCLSVRPAQVGVLLKRLNLGSHKQHHAIAQ